MDAPYSDVLALWLKLTERSELPLKWHARFVDQVEGAGLHRHVGNPGLEAAGARARCRNGDEYVLRLTDWAAEWKRDPHAHFVPGLTRPARTAEEGQGADNGKPGQIPPREGVPLVRCINCSTMARPRSRCPTCGTYVGADSASDWDLT